MEFREGGMVVVPGCGVGQIEDIEVVQMDDITVSMYRIVVEGDVRIWVPTATARLQGIRRPVAEERVQALLDAVRDTTAPTERATWNRRQRRYTEQLMSNDPLQLAELLGELASVRSRKALSFGERRLFDRAVTLLGGELRVAAEDPASVEEALAEALAA
ncbi:MAG: hypothetical protein KC656_06880 [Myxococcales bacterium]|nr:hypothetical protein [Myxococcales bacterium]